MGLLPAAMTENQNSNSNHQSDEPAEHDHLEHGSVDDENHTELQQDEGIGEDEVPVTSSTANAVYSEAAKTMELNAYADSVFAQLVHHGLLKKVTDIVLAEVKIPWNLRDDATQAIHLKWCLSPNKPEFVRNQMAYYAFLSGQHAALALRRELGAVCVLPGALFRKGRESVFMETIGAAVNPMDVDEYRDSAELSVDASDMMHLAKIDETLLARRLGALTLSAKQLKVARLVLLERLDASEIGAKLNMREVYVERLIKQVTQKLNDRDEGIIEVPKPKVEKPPVAAKKVTEKPVSTLKPKSPLGNSPLLRRRPVSRADREAARD